MFVPFMVNAKEYCKVVDGDGKSIGSEISCGTEHFYIIDSNEDEIKMLAKYNLLTGITIYKEKLEEGQTCEELAASKGGTPKSDGFYNVPGYCFYSIPLNDNIIQQSEEAKSAHWDEDENYLYPQVGDVYIESNQPGFIRQSTPVVENSSFYDFELNYREEYMTGSRNNRTNILYNLFEYKNNLENDGYSINEIGLLSISELNSLAQQISNESLPLKEWTTDFNIIQTSGGFNTELHFGDIKPYFSDGYSWLYSTTYWNSSTFKDLTTQNNFNREFFVFTAEQGKLCGAGFAPCAPETALGCGVRPTVTISNELQYLIKTETDGKGSIDVVENSLGGETIQFKVSMNKEYKLRSIVIKADSGEIVEFSEGEITKNDDGSLSIDKNKFTMPFENVTIQAKFELENILKNPETGDKVLLITLILLASIGIGSFMLKKKESRYNV